MSELMKEVIIDPIYLNERTCVLPGSEIFCRDPRNRTIVIWGHIIDLMTGRGTRNKVFAEVPQGVIRYQVSKEEVIERIAVDQYQMVLVNGVVSNAQSAVFAIKHSREPLIVIRDDNIFLVASKTEDEYVEITVELRY